MKWLEYYKGKTVLVTGHTGFKGSWLCVMLEMAGAKVVGYALPPEKDAVLFDCSGAAERMVSVEGDIRDRAHLQEVFHTYQPQVVFHLAAQPIVRTSYEQPVYTYETNVMGTVNLLECVRNTPGVQSVLNVTTDKVYENKEWEWGYRENDPLDGFDPYSNSKSCSELVTHSYKKSFLDEKGIAVSTARAGNVIGGGDFSRDRIIPDCVSWQFCYWYIPLHGRNGGCGKFCLRQDFPVCFFWGCCRCSDRSISDSSTCRNSQMARRFAWRERLIG